MHRKIPAWLIGGGLGVLYFLSIFTFDFIINDFGRAKESFGLLTAFLNLPGALLFSAPFIPYVLRIDTAFQFTAIALTDFIIGALIGLLIRRTFGRRKEVSPSR